ALARLLSEAPDRGDVPPGPERLRHPARRGGPARLCDPVDERDARGRFHLDRACPHRPPCAPWTERARARAPLAGSASPAARAQGALGQVSMAVARRGRVLHPVRPWQPALTPKYRT